MDPIRVACCAATPSVWVRPDAVQGARDPVRPCCCDACMYHKLRITDTQRTGGRRWQGSPLAGGADGHHGADSTVIRTVI